jgi:hypothetical protein
VDIGVHQNPAAWFFWRAQKIKKIFGKYFGIKFGRHTFFETLKSVKKFWETF